MICCAGVGGNNDNNKKTDIQTEFAITQSVSVEKRTERQTVCSAAKRARFRVCPLILFLSASGEEPSGDTDRRRREASAGLGASSSTVNGALYVFWSDLPARMFFCFFLFVNFSFFFVNTLHLEL